MKKREVWVKPEIKAAFEAKLVECLAKCQPHHHETLPTPKLIFKNIGGPGGRNLYNPVMKNSVITINPAYFQKPGGYEEQLNITLPHELAHHVTDFIHGVGRHIKDHGWQWARTMGWLGLPAVRCHRMDSEGIVQRHERPYSYKCGCGTPHLLTARLHLRIQRDGRTRICKRCHAKIVYEGIKVGTAFLPAAKPVPVQAPLPKPLFLNVTSLSNGVLATEKTPVAFVEPEPPKPKPAPLPEPKYRVVTRLVNGCLTNVRIPLDNP